MASATRSERFRWALAAAIFAGALLYRFVTLDFKNDAFAIISEARQVLLFGEHPFRDFSDPGRFLQIYTSTLFQLIFGDRLAGESILSVVLIALSAALVFMLSSHVARSAIIGIAITLLYLGTEPSSKNYAKVAIHAVSSFVCWKYLGRMSIGDLVRMALWTGLAFLFRHDHGVSSGLASVVLLVVAHRTDPRRMLGRLVLYVCVVAGMIVPFLVYLHLNGGVLDYVRSSSEYIRSETQRQGMFARPEFVLDPWTDPRNAVTWLYYLFIGLPVIAVLVLLAKQVSPRRAAESVPFEAAKILSVVVLCAAAAPVLLRRPTEVRLADAAAATAVIGAWLLGQSIAAQGALLRRAARGLANGRRWRGMQRGVPLFLLVGFNLGAVLAVLGLTVLSVAAVTNVEEKLDRYSSPRAVGRRASETLTRIWTSPPIDAWASAESTGLRGLTRYVHECTKPTDRLLVTRFSPDAYFYSGRGFAGDQLFYLRGYLASPEAQHRTIARMQGQSVPIVIMSDDLRGKFRLIYDYLMATYRNARGPGRSDPAFGSFTLLIHRDAVPTGAYEPLSLPCFR